MNDLVALSELIESYGTNKGKLDEYDKMCKQQNAEIKQVMREENIAEAFGDTFKVKYIVQHRESMNEELLLEIAHHHGISEIIKTKEYIDYDALENAIYKGLISADIIAEMDKAKETKEVITLKISPIQKKGK